MLDRPSLLVNWVYTATVGHAIEGFKRATAFKRANPAFEVCVLVNREAGAELGTHVPEIDRVFAVDLQAPLAWISTNLESHNISGRNSDPTLAGPPMRPATFWRRG